VKPPAADVYALVRKALSDPEFVRRVCEQAAYDLGAHRHGRVRIEIDLDGDTAFRQVHTFEGSRGGPRYLREKVRLAPTDPRPAALLRDPVPLRGLGGVDA
jgi:hypothetical protein